MVVDVTPGEGLSFGTPHRLFAGPYVVNSREDDPRAYDVSRDGKRVLMFLPDMIDSPAPVIHVLLNWTQRLAR
jgi:hypothetical protein